MHTTQATMQDELQSLSTCRESASMLATTATRTTQVMYTRAMIGNSWPASLRRRITQMHLILTLGHIMLFQGVI